MKILFFSHYFPPEGNAPASRTFDHCVRWAKAGHDVTVVTCVPNVPNGVPYAGYQNTLRSQERSMDGVRVVRVWSYLAANAGTLRRILNYLSYMFSAVLAGLRLPRADVVIATSPQFFCGWAGVFVSMFKRVPLVLEVRDIWPESIETVGAIQNRWLLGLLQILEKWMYRAATHIVTVGHGYRDKIVEKAAVKDRISVIYNGVDLDQYHPVNDREVEWDDTRLRGKFVCSYIGTIGMAHGLEVVVDAAQCLMKLGRDDVVFCLVGDGAARAALEHLVQEGHLEQRVIFLGQRPKSEIPQILASSGACLIHLRSCDLFKTVIPSKIFESMAMGRPIIMGVEGEARDIVMEAHAALPMEPGNSGSLVQAVLALADSRELAHELSATARVFVARSFNRDVMAERYLALLTAVVGRNVPFDPPTENRGSPACLVSPDIADTVPAQSG